MTGWKVYFDTVKKTKLTLFAILLAIFSGSLVWMPALADDGIPEPPPDAPDLIIQSITWSPEFPLVDDIITFKAVAKNQGTKLAEPSTLAWYIDNVLQASDPVGHIEPGAVTTTTFTWKAKRGPHVLKGIIDSGSVIIESDETNNANMCSFYVIGADLVIEDISWSPNRASIGDRVVFTITVKNQGRLPAGGSNVELFIDGFSRGYVEVPTLEAGASVKRTFSWASQEGTHSIKAAADTLNQVVESDETNNERVFTYSTAAPDLVISGISSQSNLREGETDNITVTVKNQGIGRAEPSYLACYVDDKYLSSAFIGRLEAGTSASVNAAWVVEAGAHMFKAAADFKEGILESDETNNASTIALPLIIPDLAIQGISWSPSSVLTGQTLEFLVTIVNRGGARASFFRVYLYINEATRLQQDVFGLDAGATVTVHFPWTVRAYSYVVKAVADPQNTIIESDESNNSRTVTAKLITAPLPDLIIGDVTWSPTNPLPGEKVVFTVNIKNQGSGNANPVHVAGYVDDVTLAPAYVNEIDAAVTATVSFDWAAQGGSHTFRAVADYSRVQEEANENNNEKKVTFSIAAPDLFVQSIALPVKKPAPGSEVEFLVTIKNKGDAIASRSFLAYYLDESYKGYHDLPQIDAGATVTDAFKWTVLPDEHTIRVVVDASNTVNEINENNNQRTAVFPFPDIVPTIKWSPQNPVQGDNITFTIYVQNIGAGRVGSSSIDFLVDGKHASYIAVPEIAAGSTASPTFNWTAQKGQHTFKVLADALSEVDESDKSNNEAAVAIPVLLSSPVPSPAPKPSPSPSPPPTVKPTAVSPSPTASNPKAKTTPAASTGTLPPMLFAVPVAVVLGVGTILMMKSRKKRPK